MFNCPIVLQLKKNVAVGIIAYCSEAIVKLLFCSPAVTFTISNCSESEMLQCGFEVTFVKKPLCNVAISKCYMTEYAMFVENV